MTGLELSIAYTACICGMIACVLYFFRVWRFNNQTSTVATPFLLFCLLEVLLNWPAAFWAPIAGRSSDLYPLALALIAFASFLTGVLFTGRMFRHRSSAAAEYRQMPVIGSPVALYWLGAGALVGLLLALSFMLYRGVPPIVESLKTIAIGSDDPTAAVSLGQSRRMLTKGHYFGQEYRGQGLLRMILRVGWPFMTAMCLTQYVRTKSRAWATLSLISFALTFLFVAGEGTRAPFIFSLVFLLVVISLLKPLKYRTIVITAVAGFMLMWGLSLTSTKLRWALERENAVAVMARSISERIALSNGFNTVAIVELVRRGDWELRYGRVHVQRVLNAIPGVEAGTPFSHQLYLALNPYGNATTYYSATYLGDVYIDFGLPGIIVVYFYLGALIAYLQVMLMRLPRTVLNVTSVGYMFFALGFIPLTGPIGFLSTLPVLVAIHTVPMLAMSVFSTRRIARLARA